MYIGNIKTASPFKELFPINKRVLDDIVWDMKRYGFDVSKPLVLWKDHDNILIDGHTRLRAAEKAGIFQVPVIIKRFDDEDAALKYAIRCQQHRRNLTDSELVTCVLELSKKINARRYTKTAREIAAIIGTSRRNVQKIRTIINLAPKKMINQIKIGRLTINSAYNRCRLPYTLGNGLADDDLEEFCSIISRRFNPEQIDTIIEKLIRKDRVMQNKITKDAQ